MAPNCELNLLSKAPKTIENSLEKLGQNLQHLNAKEQIQTTTSQSLNQDKPVYPFVWTPIGKEEKMKRREIYYANGPWCVSPKASMLDLIVSSPGNVLMPRTFETLAEEIYNFKLRPDDVFVVTYPKCGTTWTQEMVWQILHGFDTDKGQESLLTRSPFLEMQALVDTKVDKETDIKVVNSLEAANNLPSPRVIKTHLPIEMLPPNLLDTCKVVFVARNPMDCCVSFYHHEKLVPKMGFAGTFDQYAELFRNGRNPMGDYFYHLMSGWTRRDHKNLKFLWFEDMKSDLSTVLYEMCDFLGVKMTTKQVNQLEDHLHIDNFRKNNSVNMTSNYSKEKSNGSFIRSGKVGGWRQHFSDERVEDWRNWIEDNTKGTGLSFSQMLD